MPRTIEHKIKLLDRPATPPAHHPSSVEYRPEYGGAGTLVSNSGGGEGHFPQFSTAHREQEEEKEEGNWPMGNSRSRSHIAPEKPARRYHYESKQGDEVTYGTESFERNLRYSPNEIERQHFSSRSFGERNSLGGDGESRANVRFEDEVEPVRPIDPDYDNPAPFAHPTHRSSDEWEAEARPEEADGRVRLLHRTKHLDTTPIRIPRPRVDSPGKNGTIPSNKSPSNKWHHSQPSQKPLPPPLSFSSSVGPSRQSWHTSSSGLGQSEPEQRAANRGHQSPSSVDSSGGAYSSVPMPMKKVIRKSRWVSIHDGRPVTKFVETVHYEPAIGGSRSAVDGQRHAHFSPELWTSSSSCSLSSADEACGDGQERGKWKDVESCQPNSSRPPPSQSVYVTQNPVYSIGL